jgi:YesN/AraC family two-component response regulator
MAQVKILIVDDEEDVLERLAKLVARRFKCEVEQASNGTIALEKLKKEKFDVMMLDIKMPGLSGIDVIREAAKFTPETKILAISGYDSQEVAEEALKAGAVDFLHKPQTPDAIELKLKDILIKMGKY